MFGKNGYSTLTIDDADCAGSVLQCGSVFREFRLCFRRSWFLVYLQLRLERGYFDEAN